jgi:TatD DNase family protein
MIDSHCHLADKQFDADFDAVLQRAANAGVERMITIADSIPEAEKCIALAEKYDQIFCTVGVHPHAAKDWDETTLARLRSLAQSSPKVKAIGEIGLDYHYNFSPVEAQRQAFASQLTLARDLDLPAVVHCREAVEDIWAIVREFHDLRIVVHCCTEAWEDVEQFVGTGHFLSFTGIATYPASDIIRETIKQCPIENMMIETDAPYLAPVPHRGKRNEPAFVAETFKLVADLKGLDLAEADKRLTANTVEFFGLPQ